MLTTKIKQIALFIPLCLVLLSLTISSDIEDPRIEKIKTQLEKFYDNYPQQKVFLHTDRNTYNVGDNIWVSAYLSIGTFNIPDTTDQIVYVDLVNTNDDIYHSRLLKTKQGLAHGDFLLSDTIPQGTYYLRAYTNWMLNFDKAFIYTQRIFISNPNPSKWLTSKQQRTNKKDNRKLEKLQNKIDLQFFPEGGDLVQGIESVIAFKAINGNGIGVEVEGFIADQGGNKVCDFKSIHRGMGSFKLQPEKDKKYKAVVLKPEKIKCSVELPEVSEKGIVMEVSLVGHDAFVKIKNNLPPSNDAYGNEVILFSHMRGYINMMTKGNLNNKEMNLKIPLKKLPDGILHVTLFNGRGEPVCERLVFVNNQRQANVVINTNKKQYAPREKVDLKVRLSDAGGNPIKTSLSLAVSDKRSDTLGDHNNIVSYLLLGSDLKGYIEEPREYFVDTTLTTRQHLDLLMLTQGWSRFVWKKILADEYPVIECPVERTISISGTVTRDLTKVPYEGARVTLNVLNSYNDFFQTYTDSRGRYIFNDLDYNDTISVKIEAYRENDQKNLVLSVDQLEPLQLHSVKPFAMKLLTGVSNRELKKQPSLSHRTYEDKETGIYGEPDATLYVNKTQASSYSNILEYMKGRLTGVAITGSSIIIRGVNTIYGSTDPLIIVDGVTSDVGILSMINPNDVERIEVLKGSSTSMFGSRGSNGVIAVYTERGHFIPRALEFKKWGYYKAREFYAPKYETENNITTPDQRETLYWNPQLETDENGEANVSFYNSDKKSDFNVTLTGLNKEGIPMFGTYQYKVE